MSIQVVGSLSVMSRKRRDGEVFSVGVLQTELGSFDVKHPVLDEFEKGTIEGVFFLTKIYPVSNYSMSTNKAWVSIHADLDWNAVKVMNQSEEVESEMLETMATLEEVISTPQPEPTPTTAHSDDNLVSSKEALQALLDADAHEIKLDSTIERPEFLDLKAMVKDTGRYQFQANGQKWVRKEQSAQSAE